MTGHGIADDHVSVMHSLRMAGELFLQTKTFTFLPLAGFAHIVPDPVVTGALNERIEQFFFAHLRP